MRTKVTKEPHRNTTRRLETLLLDKPVLLVGAGISAGSGMPLAWNIKEAILHGLCSRSQWLRESWIASRDLWLERAQPVMLEALLQSVARLSPGFEQSFAPPFLQGKPSAYHCGIARLLLSGKVSGVITTNFDTLMEEAWRAIAAVEGAGQEFQVRFESGPAVRAGPVLYKLHGCASSPESIEFTLARVGKGLDGWKVRVLQESAQRPFVVIGYSDRDKDISPVLSRLDNQWFWLLYDGVPVEGHIQSDSMLDLMLARPRRGVVWTDPEVVLAGVVDTSPVEASKAERSQDVDWKELLSCQISQMPLLDTVLALSEILRDQLSLGDDSAKILSSALERESVPLSRIQFLMRLNIIFGERWDMSSVERNLEEIDRLASSAQLPEGVKAGIVRQKASFRQQESIRIGEEAAELFELEAGLRHGMGDIVGEAWAKQNKAVTLHKQARHSDAEPLFREALECLRSEGELERLAQTLVNYGSLLSATRRTEEAEAVFREALEAFYMIGNLHWVGRCKVNLAWITHRQGRTREAQALAREAADLLSAAKDSHWLDSLRRLLNTIGG